MLNRSGFGGGGLLFRARQRQPSGRLRSFRGCSLGGRMRRREFITVLGGSAAAWPIVALAQKGERMRRIGVLPGAGDRDDPRLQPNISAFVQTLQQLGWTDGRNVKIDYRWPAGDA